MKGCARSYNFLTVCTHPQYLLLHEMHFLIRQLLKEYPTQFVVLQKKKKTVDELKKDDIPNYMEKEELALFLKTVSNQGLEMDFQVFLTLS